MPCCVRNNGSEALCVCVCVFGVVWQGFRGKLLKTTSDTNADTHAHIPFISAESQRTHTTDMNTNTTHTHNTHTYTQIRCILQIKSLCLYIYLFTDILPITELNNWPIIWLINKTNRVMGFLYKNDLAVSHQFQYSESSSLTSVQIISIKSLFINTLQIRTSSVSKLCYKC